MANTIPWYCGWFDFADERLKSCVLSANQQVENMPFGNSADPALVKQAKDEFARYLRDSHYDDTIRKLEDEDEKKGGLEKYLPLLMVVAAFGMISMIGGPSRYGR